MLFATINENNVPEPIIFYADDDADDRQLLRRALTSLGTQYMFVEAEDGAEAVSLLQQMKASGKLPSLIVIDINMPKVDGKQAYMQIKSDELLSRIPIVIYSTSKSELDRLFFRRKNTIYITKPSDYGLIEQVAARMLSYCSKVA